MVSIEELKAELESFQASWHDLRPFLIQYLPRDKARLNRADRLLLKAEHLLEKATQAERQGRKLPAFWWYTQSLTAFREHGELMDRLSEIALKAQANAKKPAGA